ncbi:MAG: MATE family efflux transporter [Barnesiella sp.]|nr:MATE family efflux transporter [Barnesiella sp.]MBD5344201.1 MATE family efflux transporter [Bacteroides sp.]
MNRIDRSILRIAVPSIVVNITTPLLSLMDVTFTGHMGSATYLAAIAVGGTIFNMIYWIFGFLRMGTSGITAQAYGRSTTSSCSDGRAEVTASLLRGLAIAAIAGLIIILLRHPIAAAGLDIMDVDGDTAASTLRYFLILSAGAPAVLATYVFTGWLIGMQDSRSPMWMSLTINVVNIAVSFALVVGLGMKIEGVAVGTLVAQWTGCLMGAVIIWRRHRPASVTLSRVWDAAAMKKFFRVNSDIFLRTLCLVGVTVWFTRAGASAGTVTLAVNALLMQFFYFFSYFMDGFAFAGEALTGRYTGAHDRDGLRSVIKALLRWGLMLGVVFSIVYMAAGTVAVDLLTSETAVREASREYMAWIVTVPLAGFAAFTFDGIFIGATMTRAMLASMFAAMITYFAAYFLLTPFMGNHALWLAFVLYLAVRGGVLGLMSPRLLKL